MSNQIEIDKIDNGNIAEYYLEVKKLYLNRRGNRLFANNLLKYLNIVWFISDISDCLTQFMAFLYLQKWQVHNEYVHIPTTK